MSKLIITALATIFPQSIDGIKQHINLKYKNVLKYYEIRKEFSKRHNPSRNDESNQKFTISAPTAPPPVFEDSAKCTHTREK